jgi:hypothetical protein
MLCGFLGVYSGRQGRAVVVYFSLPSTLQRFTSSTYYQQVGKKHLLEETQTHRDKDHVIKKAATSGQVGPVFLPCLLLQLCQLT